MVCDDECLGINSDGLGIGVALWNAHLLDCRNCHVCVHKGANADGAWPRQSTMWHVWTSGSRNGVGCVPYVSEALE
jgi:hypothetical protein